MSGRDFDQQYPEAPQSSGKALASLILGISGLVVIPVVGSVLAIVFAVLARADIAKSGGRLGGAGNAQAGLILGWIGLALVALGIGLLLLVIASFDGDGGIWNY